VCFHLYYVRLCISLYTCANVICIKLLITYLLTSHSCRVTAPCKLLCDDDDDDDDDEYVSYCHVLLSVLGESVTTGLSWAQVAEHVGTRSEKQCRTKWLNYLNWKQKGGAEWTRNDDMLLLNK